MALALAAELAEAIGTCGSTAGRGGGPDHGRRLGARWRVWSRDRGRDRQRSVGRLVALLLVGSSHLGDPQPRPAIWSGPTCRCRGFGTRPVGGSPSTSVNVRLDLFVEDRRHLAPEGLLKGLVSRRSCEGARVTAPCNGTHRPSASAARADPRSRRSDRHRRGSPDSGRGCVAASRCRAVAPPRVGEVTELAHASSVAPGQRPPNHLSMCPSDRKRFIVLHVKTMSSHHRGRHEAVEEQRPVIGPFVGDAQKDRLAAIRTRRLDHAVDMQARHRYRPHPRRSWRTTTCRLPPLESPLKQPRTGWPS